jgi:hypothetical protein
MLAYRALGDDGSAARAARAAADANEILAFERRVGRVGLVRLASKPGFRVSVLAVGVALAGAVFIGIARTTSRSTPDLLVILILTLWPAVIVGALAATGALVAAGVERASRSTDPIEGLFEGTWRKAAGRAWTVGRGPIAAMAVFEVPAVLLGELDFPSFVAWLVLFVGSVASLAVPRNRSSRASASTASAAWGEGRRVPPLDPASLAITGGSASRPKKAWFFGVPTLRRGAPPPRESRKPAVT